MVLIWKKLLKITRGMLQPTRPRNTQLMVCYSVTIVVNKSIAMPEMFLVLVLNDTL